MSFFSSMSQSKNSAYRCHVLVSKQWEFFFFLLFLSYLSLSLFFFFVCVFVCVCVCDLNTVKGI